MASPCPRCGNPLDAEGVCASCAFAGVLDEPVVSAFPLELEEAAQRIAKRRRLVDLEPLGKGGMGFVFRARQVQLDRDVALKLFAAGTPERFEREARVLASLSHPNIVAIHDFGFEERRPYFMMEYLDGASLRTLIDMGGMSQRRALEILEQVGRALEYAHARGVIHRDIKPENVLTSVDGVVKVGDFGIARLADQEGDPGGGSGTPEYMAPERRHIPGAADERSDIYSLGALAREMLAGSGPVDDRIDDLVRRALDPDPAKRFRNATEFLETLRTIRSPGGALTPIPMVVRSRRLFRSPFGVALALGSLASALVFSGLVGNYGPPRPEPAFERLLRATTTSEELSAKYRIREAGQDRVDALILREAASDDIQRAIAAFQVALMEGRVGIIPAGQRIRALRARMRMPESLAHIARDGLHDPYTVDREFMRAADDGGPHLAHLFFRELASGRCEGREALLFILALARNADAPLVLEMQDFLLNLTDSKIAHPILIALVARTDLPLHFSPDRLPIYQRHLPNLLDPQTGEARWEEAVQLARELLPDHPPNDFSHVGLWLAEWAPGARSDNEDPKPENSIDKGWKQAWPKLEWPIEENVALQVEQQLRTQTGLGRTYALAVMLRWRRTGRFTLPLYPYRKAYFETRMPDDRLLQHGLMRWRNHDHVESVLGPASDSEWECMLVTALTLAGRPQVAVSARGRGPVELSNHAQIPLLGVKARVQVSIGSLIPQPSQGTSFTVHASLKGDFQFNSFLSDWEFRGSQMDRTQGPGFSGHNGGGANGRGRPREAMIVTNGLWRMQTQSIRYGSFWAILLDPPLGADPETRWRLAVAEGLKRLSGGTFKRLEAYDTERLLEVASWTPVPEAGEGLRALWKRRGELRQNPEDHREPDRIVEMLSSALLMAGDDAPMAHPELLDKLKPETAFRIFLFSPSEKVRAAVESRATPVLQSPTAAGATRILEDRGDKSSAVMQAAAAVLAKDRWETAQMVLPWIVAALVLVGLGWLPRAKGYAPAVAASLVFTGLVFRLVSFEVGGRLWIPFVGYFFFLVAAMVSGGWFYRTLASVLALFGLLQLMNPEWTTVTTLGTLLLCVYLAATSLDGVTRRLPRTLPRHEKVATALAWWLFITPVFVFCVLALAPWPGEVPPPNFWWITGIHPLLFVAVMLYALLWPAHCARRRLLSEATS